MKQLSTIIEGLFDVEDSVGKIDKEAATRDILTGMGLEVLLVDGGVYYCESLKPKVVVNSKFLKQYPAELDTLAISCHPLTLATTPTGIKNVFTGDVELKNVKVSDIDFRGFGLDFNNKKEATQMSAGMSGQTEVVNCSFGNIEELVFNLKNTSFKNVSMYNDYPLNIYVVFPGTKTDVDDWVESVLPEEASEPITKILKHIGIELEPYNGVYLDVIPTTQPGRITTYSIWQSRNMHSTGWKQHTKQMDISIKKMIKNYS